MTQERGALYDAWLAVHHRPAWLAVMVDGLGLDAEDEAYLNNLDGALVSLRRVQHKSRDQSRILFEDYRDEVRAESPELVRNARESFLVQEVARLTGLFVGIRMLWGKVAVRARSKAVAEFAAAMGQEDPIANALSRARAELVSLRRGPEDGRIEERDILAARQYPLWRLLDRRPGERINCPMHEDTSRTLALYEGGNGYCFRCNKSINAIGWLRIVEKLSFQDAVRRLVKA